MEDERRGSNYVPKRYTAAIHACPIHGVNVEINRDERRSGHQAPGYERVIAARVE